MAVFESDNTEDLALMNRNKGTHLRKAMEISLEEFNSTWLCPVYLLNLRSVVFLNLLLQGIISIQGSIFMFLIMIICVHH